MKRFCGKARRKNRTEPQKAYIYLYIHINTPVDILGLGFPGGASGKESACQGRRRKRHGFHPWVGKISWSRKWQPTPLFLAWKIP